MRKKEDTWHKGWRMAPPDGPIDGRSAICSVCGRPFWANKSFVTHCPDCRGKRSFHCAMCGRRVIVGSNSPARYCPDCRRKAMSKTRTGASRSEETRAKISRSAKTPERREQLLAIQGKAVEASNASPLSGPYETNQAAKTWRLRSPWNEAFAVRNLSLFIRNHPEWFTNGQSAEKAFCGYGRKMRLSDWNGTIYTYKGWQLLEPPEK